MPIVDIGSRRFTTVVHQDPPGTGNACHHYEVCRTMSSELEQDEAQVYATVHFQDGPILESGVNGCHNEDLIAIVLHRLSGFQDGPWRGEENQKAIQALFEALQYLNARTTRRQEEGVEGTHAL